MKRKYIFIILTLIIVVFLLQYFLIISYIEKMFQYTTLRVKNEVIINEIEFYKVYIIERTFFVLLQSLGMFICLNIGFLYFKIKISLKYITHLVVFSLISVIISQFLIIVFIKLNNWTLTMGSINTMAENLNLGNYINVEKTAPWIKLSLRSINIEQLLILILLGIGMHKIIKINYRRSFSISVRTYGLGILLWFVFAMVMEMNFY